MRPILAAHLAHSEGAGPEESNHTLGIEELQAADMQFFAAYLDGAAVGCAGLKTLPDGTSEVKSVHVTAAARGQGIARRLMDYLAQVAKAEGRTALVLETGADHLTEYAAARKLYEALGYTYCGPICGYEVDYDSAFMRLDL